MLDQLSIHTVTAQNTNVCLSGWCELANFGVKPFIVFGFLFHGVIDTINKRSQKPQLRSLPDDPECTSAKAPLDKQGQGQGLGLLNFQKCSLFGLHPVQNLCNLNGLLNCCVSAVRQCW